MCGVDVETQAGWTGGVQHAGQAGFADALCQLCALGLSACEVCICRSWSTTAARLHTPPCQHATSSIGNLLSQDALAPLGGCFARLALRRIRALAVFLRTSVMGQSIRASTSRTHRKHLGILKRSTIRSLRIPRRALRVVHTASVDWRENTPVDIVSLGASRRVRSLWRLGGRVCAWRERMYEAPELRIRSCAALHRRVLRRQDDLVGIGGECVGSPELVAMYKHMLGRSIGWCVGGVMESTEMQKGRFVM